MAITKLRYSDIIFARVLIDFSIKNKHVTNFCSDMYLFLV